MKRLRFRYAMLFLVDVVLINVGYFLAFRLRFPFGTPGTNMQSFLHVLPYINLWAFFLLWAYELHQERVYRRAESLTSILLVVLLLNIGAMVLAFWLRDFAFPRTIFILAFLLQMVILIGWYRVWWWLKVKLEGEKQAMVVGHNGEAASMVDMLMKDIGRENAVTEISCTSAQECDDKHEQGQEIPWNELEEALAPADVVYITGDVSREQLQDVLAFCLSQNKEVYLVPGAYEIMLQNAAVMRVGDQPVLRIGHLSLTPWQKISKRVEDMLLVAIAGIIGLFISPFIIAAIKLTSPGHILFKQLRSGQDGKTFYIYKFRTMIPDAEKLTGPVLATENDPRITPVGRILRATRLDEIPQIINILKGDMSFVGPRPERPVFVEQFTRENPAYVHRLKVKPGITGLAQVKGNYDTDAVDKLRYDLYYIRNYSLWLDLKIILQTVRVVLTPEAAKGVGDKDKVQMAQ